MNSLLRWTGVSFCAFAVAISTVCAQETKAKSDGKSKSTEGSATVVGDISVSIHTSGVDSKAILEHLTKSLEESGASREVQGKVLADVKKKLDAFGATTGGTDAHAIKVDPIDPIAGRPSVTFRDKHGNQHQIPLRPRKPSVPRVESIAKHQEQIVEQAAKQREQVSKHIAEIQKQMGANGIRLDLGNAGLIWMDPSIQELPQYAIGVALGKQNDAGKANDRESSERASETKVKDSAPGQVVVTDVFEDTPASAVGLKPGDLLIKLNGKKVKNEQQVRDVVASAGKADAEIELEWSRDGETHTAKIKPKKNEPAFIDNLRFNLSSLDNAVDREVTEKQNQDQKSSSEVEALKERLEQLEKEIAEIKQLIPAQDK